MTQIILSRVSYAHTDSVPLIRDLSLQLEVGWTGIVGANGAGKTTLLRLLTGELAPEAGAVQAHPPSLRACLCAQTIEELGPDVRALAEAEDGPARRLRARLALDPVWLLRWPSLSPGERKRWQVGAALFSEPDLLALDEPTNHLDVQAREQLAAALAGFRGVGLLVSHDRALLDGLTERTLRFQNGEVRLWRGGYSEARESWEREEREMLDAYQSLQTEKRKLKRRAADARQKRAEAEARVKRKKRQAGPKDSDTRLRYGAKRRRSAEVHWGWEVHKLKDKIERVDDRAAAFGLHKQVGRSLFVDFEPARVPRLMHLRCSELRAGGQVLVRDVDLKLRRESRVHLAGRNGAGKTTLLRAFLAGCPLPGSRVLHLPQELSDAEGVALLAELRRADSDERGRVLAILAALGVDPETFLASQRPSPGEARKLALAFGLARRVWALVLDEPTNHLDLPSILRIEAALADYPGALLLVTHDDAFAERLTQTQWRLEDGRVRVSGRS